MSAPTELVDIGNNRAAIERRPGHELVIPDFERALGDEVTLGRQLQQARPWTGRQYLDRVHTHRNAVVCAHLRHCSKTLECLSNQALPVVSAGSLEPDHTREVTGSSPVSPIQGSDRQAQLPWLTGGTARAWARLYRRAANARVFTAESAVKRRSETMRFSCKHAFDLGHFSCGSLDGMCWRM